MVPHIRKEKCEKLVGLTKRRNEQVFLDPRLTRVDGFELTAVHVGCSGLVDGALFGCILWPVCKLYLVVWDGVRKDVY